MKALDSFGIDDVYLLNPAHQSLFASGKLDLYSEEGARSGNMWRVLGCLGLTFLVAIVLPVVGLSYEIWQETRINRDGVAIDAQITDCQIREAGGAEVTFLYVLLDSTGVPRTYTGSEVDSGIMTCLDFTPSTEITVRVLPDEPETVRWRESVDWTQALCVVGAAIFFGVPFLLFRAISTRSAFKKGDCLDALQRDGYLKLGKVVESRWKTPKVLEITYHVTTHEGNHITGVASAEQSERRTREKPPRQGTQVVVAYTDARCHRLL